MKYIVNLKRFGEKYDSEWMQSIRHKTICEMQIRCNANYIDLFSVRTFDVGKGGSGVHQVETSLVPSLTDLQREKPGHKLRQSVSWSSQKFRSGTFIK